MGVAPAGSDRMNSGHHHLIIDAPTPPLNVEIPNDSQQFHFGAGQTETELTLTPGEHTLQRRKHPVSTAGTAALYGRLARPSLS